MIHIGASAAAGEVWPGTRGGGIETVVSCEIGAFGSDVLASLFPAAYHHKDIRTLTKTIIDERLIPRFGTDYGRRTILTGGSHRACIRQTSQAPHRADKRFNEEALRAAGNAIVPQVAYEIIRGIIEIERGEHFPDVRKEADKV